ncbi:MAG: type IX secretion system sortase PorU [Marinilabiliales bacterium]|nr:type IX secretion system sortase PorU [Marinilabiliales bacterium]
MALSHEAAGNSMLFSDGKWLKISVSETGIHKIDYSWLKENGFDHPENVRIYAAEPLSDSEKSDPSEEGKLTMLPVLRVTEGTGAFLFYNEGVVTWQYDATVNRYLRILHPERLEKSFFFLSDQPTLTSDRLEQQKSIIVPASEDVTAYDDPLLWEEEKINLLESGQRWFTTLLMGNGSATKNWSVPGRIASEPIHIHVVAAARSSAPSVMYLFMNGSVFGKLDFASVPMTQESDFAVESSGDFSVVSPGTSLSLAVSGNATASGQSWLDYAVVTVRRALQYQGQPINFHYAQPVGKVGVARFNLANGQSGLQLWNVTNPMAPLQVTCQMNGTNLSFQADVGEMASYLLFDPSSDLPKVTKEGVVSSDNIRGLSPPEMLVVTTPEFSSQADRLASFHSTHEGLDVAVVQTESLYNEFSGGYKSPLAIRRYIRHLLSAPNGSRLKYLLLFGKGTFDSVHPSDENNPDWVPSWQSESSLNPLSCYESDDYFSGAGLSADGIQGAIPLGVGRIPCATVGEATLAVDKITQYAAQKNAGEWEDNLVFIGDDQDNNVHVANCESLVKQVGSSNPAFHATRVYLDGYPLVNDPDPRYPAASNAIVEAIQRGTLVVNYTGHANEDVLAAERVFTMNEIDKLTNKGKLPLFVTATCEFGRWDMKMKRSSGEKLLFKENGGAIALLSATRLVYSSSNAAITSSFYRHLTDVDPQGNPLRLGDLIRLGKNENQGSLNSSKFSLLGDPALRLRIPPIHCRDLQINHQSLKGTTVIASPMTAVTVEGEITGKTGERLDQYNGILQVTVWDQPVQKQTLGNGGQPPFHYDARENVLFRGEVAIRNGSYSYAFPVPKEVIQTDGKALIRYFFTDGNLDGDGYDDALVVNGQEKVTTNDHVGPQIVAFLEDDKFRDGGTVSAYPLLLLQLSDESGISTVGGTTGHDIRAVLDGDENHSLILNDGYQADAGTWKSGRLLYTLSDLAEGDHTLKIIVWDTVGNSSEKLVHFKVGNGFSIQSVVAYPNPFSDKVTFRLQQNRYNELLHGRLEIFDLHGRLLHSSYADLMTEGYLSDELSWNAATSSLNKGNGILIFRITLTTGDGAVNSFSGRLFYRK